MVSAVCWDVYVFLTDVNIARSVESSLPVFFVCQAVRGEFEHVFFLKMGLVATVWNVKEVLQY